MFNVHVSDQISDGSLQIPLSVQDEIVDQIISVVAGQRPCKELRIYFSQAYPINEDKTLGKPVAMVSYDVIREGEENESHGMLFNKA